MPQSRTFSSTRSLGKDPPVLHGMNASELFQEEAICGDEALREQVRALDRGVKRRRHPGAPWGRRVVGNIPIIPIHDDPSELVHLTGADSRFVEEPPVDDCAIPVDEELLTAVADAMG